MHEAAQRSLQVISAGFNGEFNLPPELCTVIARGEGYEAEDTSGNAFLDFSMVWGSVLVGHARPEVAEAVVRQAALGATFAWVNENSLALSATRGASRASAIPSATTGWRSPASTVQTAAPSSTLPAATAAISPVASSSIARATPASATALPLSKPSLDPRPRSERRR